MQFSELTVSRRQLGVEGSLLWFAPTLFVQSNHNSKQTVKSCGRRFRLLGCTHSLCVHFTVLRAARRITMNCISQLQRCIKPVTEPDQTEPTEITELTRPNVRELPYVPGRTYGKCRYIDTEI